MRAASVKKRAFTLIELVIVISIMLVLNGVGILFLVRYLEVQHTVSARAQRAARSHLFLSHLREDVSLSERADFEFQGIHGPRPRVGPTKSGRIERSDRDASEGLILESGQPPERRMVVYQAEEGQVRRKEYREEGQEFHLLSDRGVLSTGLSIFFRRDETLPRLLWVEIEGPPPERTTSRAFKTRAALCLPFAPEEATE